MPAQQAKSKGGGHIQPVIAFLKQPLYIDNLTMAWVEAMRRPELTIFLNFITDFGAPIIFAVFGFISFLYLWLIHKRRAGFILIAGLVGSWAVMDFLKAIFARPRPMGEQLTTAGGMSFPSGHAMISLVFYGFIAYLLLRHLIPRWNKTACVIIGVLIFLIGFSRIYLNVHYITDVLAGFALGSVILLAMVRVYRL